MLAPRLFSSISSIMLISLARVPVCRLNAVSLSPCCSFVLCLFSPIAACIAFCFLEVPRKPRPHTLQNLFEPAGLEPHQLISLMLLEAREQQPQGGRIARVAHDLRQTSRVLRHA